LRLDLSSGCGAKESGFFLFLGLICHEIVKKPVVPRRLVEFSVSLWEYEPF